MGIRSSGWDGSSAIHDAFRGVRGSCEWTLRAIRWAREIDLSVQLNTTITRRNLADFDDMVRLLATLDIVLWSVFFLVPMGRGRAGNWVSAEEFEDVFANLYKVSRRATFDIKTTEAQHYRRYVAQRRAEERRRNLPPASQAQIKESPDGIGRAPRDINDGKGFAFVSHKGDVYPSGFLPLAAGNIRDQSLQEIYRNSPLFIALRDALNLKDKCGVCEFREICGGSRARAYALGGDPFAEEPCGVYESKGRKGI